VQFDRAGKAGKVELTIDMSSINTGTMTFDKHLQRAVHGMSAHGPLAWCGRPPAYAMCRIPRSGGDP